jgi:hypothetical protein
VEGYCFIEAFIEGPGAVVLACFDHASAQYDALFGGRDKVVDQVS